MTIDDPGTARVYAAIQYLLQLAGERGSGSWPAERLQMLNRIVDALLADRSDRFRRKRIALVAKLHLAIEERMQLEREGHITRSQTCEALARWFRRAGIKMSSEGVAALLEGNVREKARSGGPKEILHDHLAHAAGTSQSQFEKVLRVIERGRVASGPWGTPELVEEMADFADAGRDELLREAFRAVGLDGGAAEQLLASLPPSPEVVGLSLVEWIDIIESRTPKRERPARHLTFRIATRPLCGARQRRF